MSHLARLNNRLDKAFRLVDIAGDAHRGDAHGRTVGGAITAGLFWAVASEDHLDRALGRRPQQILGAFGLHGGLPGNQALGKQVGVNIALAFDQ